MITKKDLLELTEYFGKIANENGYFKPDIQIAIYGRSVNFHLKTIPKHKTVTAANSIDVVGCCLISLEKNFLEAIEKRVYKIERFSTDEFIETIFGPPISDK